jgi:prepilin signal peptidase PulO-like enzyme (type II secretory pathway)
VNLWAAFANEFRWIGLFVVGACLGSLANWAVASLEWRVCPNPWLVTPSGDSIRSRFRRVPILGWLAFRKEAAAYRTDAWAWGRPMLLEILAGLGLVWLYGWEIDGQRLLPAPMAPVATVATSLVFHVVLLWFMFVASLVDIDEQVIPDAVTLPATLVGLAAAIAFPWSLLPVLTVDGGRAVLGVLHLASPHPWPNAFDGAPHGGALGLALVCWWGWCVALMHRTWYTRHGLLRAWRLMTARLMRERSTYGLLGLGLLGTVAVAAVWAVGGPRWTALLSSLAGMAIGGGMIWAVRVSGRIALRREAMGFGDVTLMAMLGAFLGWQACLMIFFLAPFAGLIVGVLTLVLRRDNVIPYGPFLCLAAAFVLVRWVDCWDFVSQQFLILGPLAPIFLVFCLGLMLPLLWIVRIVRETFGHRY